MATTINLDTSQRVDIICKRGDTFSLRLTLTDSDGIATFYDSDIFLMQVRDADTNDTSTELSTSPVTPDPSVTTSVEFTFSSDTMKEIESGLYVYDIEQKRVSDSEGNTLDTPTVVTLIYGTLKVNEDVAITV